MREPFHIVVCASGGGGNFQALIDAQDSVGFIITTLITDRDCGAVVRAATHNIPCANFNKKAMGDGEYWQEFSKAIPDTTDLIVLAGYIPIIPKSLCQAWRGKMINTHPSLLPKYGGKGMVGVKVQEAVISARDVEAGCSVHFVSPEIDGGDILLQARIPVIAGETPWSLGGRVFIEENRLLVDAIKILKERANHGNVV